jgi:hypothetical protein
MKAKIVTIVCCLAFLTTLITLGCRKLESTGPKTQSGLTDAIITGNDVRACVCCGGLMITFSNDPKPYSASYYDVNSMPANTGVDGRSAFPVYVSVKYEMVPNTCGQNMVNITQLEKR